MKIMAIKLVPRWKFWKIDNWEVVVALDNGRCKTVTIFASLLKPNPSLFQEYVKNKVETGTQWPRKAERKRKKQITEEIRRGKLPEVLRELIGKEAS